ncbi:ATP-binding protein [Bacillus sp. CGMCC 1.16607]|uniref:ATP-binding protein n=1 Tax=Bacillus sp. CGMCC 1.16607 TaxID=3351842 RepID=UPI003643FA7E
MLDDNQSRNLIKEEIKATKLFLWFFYVIFISYDAIYYYILPTFADYSEYGLPKEGLGFWFHIIVLGFLPVAFYLIRSGNSHIVKYFYICGYCIVDIINILLIYLGSDKQYASGNLVEVALILFSPLFINKKYFWFVAGTLVSKSIFYGIILGDKTAYIPISIFVLIGGISYLFLARFLSYINTLIKVNDDLRQKEKLALLGQVATSIGHEIRNPLAALKGFTQLQQEKVDPNDKGYFQIMGNEIERINVIVNDLMYLGNPKPIDPKNSDIKESIQYVKKVLNPIALANQVSIKLALEEIPKIVCDEKKIKQVFINLIKNSIESMPDGGKIVVSSEVMNSNQIAIYIEDEGCGIAEETMNKLGQPFNTTKQDGTGLGLMVTQRIIHEHRGKIKFFSGLGKGTRVEIYLPMDLTDVK